MAAKKKVPTKGVLDALETNNPVVLKRELDIAQDEREDILDVIKREYQYHALRAEELRAFLRQNGIEFD